MAKTEIKLKRNLQGCNLSIEEADAFCQSLGGPDSFANPTRECYNSFVDCFCRDGYEYTGVACELSEEFSCDDAEDLTPDEWCEVEGGEGAYARQFQDCYDKFLEDCLCSNGYLHTGNSCELQGPDCASGDPNQWCQDQGGPGAYARVDVDCYETFLDHCECFDGYDKYSDYCDPVSWPEGVVRFVGIDGFPSSSFPLGLCQGDCDDDFDCQPGLVCFQRSAYTSVPGCSGGADEGSSNDYCTIEPTPSPTEPPTTSPPTPFPTPQPTNPPTCINKDPNEWCMDQGGVGAYGRVDITCLESFELDCQCFDGYQKLSYGCEEISWPEGNVKFVANDGFPTFSYPLGVCEGDCDDDNDCQSGLICFQREGYGPVPGCFGGESESSTNDYCIVRPTPVPTPLPTPPPTPMPTDSPTARPTTNSPTNPPATLSPTGSPTRVPTRSPTQQPTMATVTTEDMLFESNYVGRFQVIADPKCSVPNPTVVAGCPMGEVALTNVSHSSINCQDPILEEDGSSYFHCNTTCEGNNCSDVFMSKLLDPNVTTFQEGFGEIYFKCLGPDVNATSGWFGMAANDERSGICFSEDASGNAAFVFRTSQLGVWHSNHSVYTFQDDLFRCFPAISSGLVDGHSSCTLGSVCPGDDNGTCSIALDEVTAIGESYLYPKDCIQSTKDGSSVAVRVEEDASNVSNNGMIRPSFTRMSQFQVRSGIYYDQTECESTLSGLRLSCTNGNISIVETQAMSCSVTGPSEVHCYESVVAMARNDMMDILLYECTSTEGVPHTRIENFGSTIGCSSENTKLYFLALQAGPVCNGTTLIQSNHRNIFTCQREEGNTSLAASRQGFGGMPKVSCASSGRVPAKSGNSEVGYLDVHEIAPLKMETDYRWEIMAPAICSFIEGDNRTIFSSQKVDVNDTEATDNNKPDYVSFPVLSMGSLENVSQPP